MLLPATLLPVSSLPTSSLCLLCFQFLLFQLPLSYRLPSFLRASLSSKFSILVTTQAEDLGSNAGYSSVLTVGRAEVTLKGLSYASAGTQVDAGYPQGHFVEMEEVWVRGWKRMWQNGIQSHLDRADMCWKWRYLGSTSSARDCTGHRVASHIPPPLDTESGTSPL